MKRLKLHEMSPEDQLYLSFDGTFSPKAALERELEPFFQALETFAGDWMPEVIRGKRYRKYSRAALWQALAERRGEKSTAIGLYRTKVPALDMSLWLSFSPLRPMLDSGLTVQPLSFFTEERSRHFVDMVRAWACQ